VQQIDPIKKQAFVEVVRQSHKPAINGIVPDEFRKVRCDFLLRHVGFEIDEILCQNPRPDDVDAIDVRDLASAFQQVAPCFQLIYCDFRSGQDLNPNASLVGELVEFFSEERLRWFVEPGLVDDCEHHFRSSLVCLLATLCCRKDEETNCAQNDAASPIKAKQKRSARSHFTPSKPKSIKRNSLVPGRSNACT